MLMYLSLYFREYIAFKIYENIAYCWLEIWKMLKMQVRTLKTNDTTQRLSVLTF